MARIGILRYKDGWGRSVHCAFHAVGGEVLFSDRSFEHNGMSITNSIEEAVAEYRRQYPDETPVFYEAYDIDPRFDRDGPPLNLLLGSLTEVTVDNGIANWSPPSNEALEKWVNYFVSN